MSIWPKWSTVVSTMRRRSSGTSRSPGMTRSVSEATARRFVSLRAVRATRAPRSRKARTHAAPIPSDAPVTRATLPSIRMEGRAGEAIIVHMPQQLLPLFPLETVLFPRTPLPLHIFEDRYKEMMREILAGDGEFGVVQAGEKGIVNTGCTAVVDKIMRRYDDGRMDLVAVGRRRFEIMELDDERQFLRGAVSFFDDEEFEPVDDQVRLKVLQGYREMVDMSIPQSYQQPTLTDPQLSFQLAQCLPDLTFRQVLLATRSEGERMQQIAAFLDKWLPGQRRTAHVRAVAPLNGHGKAPDSL